MLAESVNTHGIIKKIEVMSSNAKWHKGTSKNTFFASFAQTLRTLRLKKSPQRTQGSILLLHELPKIVTFRSLSVLQGHFLLGQLLSELL